MLPSSPNPFFMAASQEHGFIFERQIMAEVERRLGPASDVARSLPNDPTARFDLPAWRDPTGAGIPTSLKVAKRSSSGRVKVDLADARRTVALGDLPWIRLVVGIYEQKGENKVIDEIREYLIPGELWSEAAGEVPLAMIHRFHNDLKKGSHLEARALASSWKSKVTQHYPGIIRWGAKIDSKSQRRLQCSIYLDELDALLEQCDQASVKVYGRATGSHVSVASALWQAPSLALPLVIPSAARARQKKGATETV